MRRNRSTRYVPEPPLSGEDPIGRHALRFSGRHAGSDRRFGAGALPVGGAFDLLGMSE